MKSPGKIILTFLLLSSGLVLAQKIDSAQYKKIYTSLTEAKKDPLKVYRLNLSNLPTDSFPVDLSKFKNLWYLCLNNDHLEFIPSSVGDLQNLRVLELNGDDFKTLPPEFSKLKNLEELYLNVNKKMDLAANVKILNSLPKLKVLHLEGDGITKLPADFNKMNHLEKLYLNNNSFAEVPVEIKGLKNLKYVDMQNNSIPLYNSSEYKTFGFKVKF
ncbi:MAG TPA: leucine-rich repeat domain-containing protein [Bacteroidia bacterium]|jgi:Leucine-rich repeat (LRR) protein|nr:leucine-rich repeat domain-containing protein [Bacteroidia bacterium]